LLVIRDWRLPFPPCSPIQRGHGYLPDLAGLCGMSRATFMRQFQDKLGRSATEMLTDMQLVFP